MKRKRPKQTRRPPKRLLADRPPAPRPQPGPEHLPFQGMDQTGDQVGAMYRERARRTMAASASVNQGVPAPILAIMSQMHAKGEVLPPRVRRRARTKIGRAVHANQVSLALSTDSLLHLIDEKLASLRETAPNSDEAKSARSEDIKHHEELRQNLVAFRDATFAFLAGKAKEKSVVESAKSFRDRIKISNKFLDVGLFLFSVSICAQTGVEPSLAAAISGALVGGKSMIDVVRAWAKKKGA